MEEKKYKITKEECEEQIRNLGDDIVCNYCGRKLQAVETVDNAGYPTHWIGCRHGTENSDSPIGHYTYGTKKWIYETAKKIVLNDIVYMRQYNGYKNVENEEEFKFAFMKQVKAWCDIIEYVEAAKKEDFEPKYTYEELKNDILNIQ